MTSRMSTKLVRQVVGVSERKKPWDLTIGAHRLTDRTYIWIGVLGSYWLSPTRSVLWLASVGLFAIGLFIIDSVAAALQELAKRG